MLRNKKIAIVSHCVFNQNAVVLPLARAAGPMKCASILMESQCGIYQMPCPEKRMCGMCRPGMNEAQFSAIRGYHELCADLVEDVIYDIKDYIVNGYTIVGMIAINGSPTCSISGTRGVMMQHLMRRLEEENILIPYLEIPESGEDEKFLEDVRSLFAAEV